jgi:hypothetical protein
LERFGGREGKVGGKKVGFLWGVKEKGLDVLELFGFGFLGSFF